MLFLKQSLILPLLYHKSAITCQIDLYKVSNSKLKPYLRICVKTKIIESMSRPQQLHKRGTIILGHPVYQTKNVYKHSQVIEIKPFQKPTLKRAAKV